MYECMYVIFIYCDMYRLFSTGHSHLCIRLKCVHRMCCMDFIFISFSLTDIKRFHSHENTSSIFPISSAQWQHVPFTLVFGVSNFICVTCKNCVIHAWFIFFIKILSFIISSYRRKIIIYLKKKTFKKYILFSNKNLIILLFYTLFKSIL